MNDLSSEFHSSSLTPFLSDVS